MKFFNYKELSRMLLRYENGADGCVCVQMFTIESVTYFSGEKRAQVQLRGHGSCGHFSSD